jgi:hypothetical protein
MRYWVNVWYSNSAVSEDRIHFSSEEGAMAFARSCPGRLARVLSYDRPPAVDYMYDSKDGAIYELANFRYGKWGQLDM